MAIIDSVSRLLKGVITIGSAENESFTPFLEHPHYTKPQVYEKKMFRKYYFLEIMQKLTLGEKISLWKCTKK